jgi:hypothetical protein
VIREKQVVYFYLVGAMDVASVAELARLGLYSLLMGAMDYCDEHREAPRIYSVWDEAQVMIAKNIENVLTQSRSHGLACVFAHQAVSQLNPPGGVDLRELVMGGTTVKWIFAARDPWLQQYIVNTSGTARYFRQSYDVSAEDVLTGMVGPEYALCDARSPAAIHVSEYTGPRITVQDILNASYDPNLSLLWIARASGLSRFRGWFPVYSDWPIPLDVHKDRLRSKWPATTDEHLEITSDWPNESEQTITATTHPPLSLDEQTDLANRKLDALRRKLEKK